MLHITCSSGKMLWLYHLLPFGCKQLAISLNWVVGLDRAPEAVLGFTHTHL